MKIIKTLTLEIRDKTIKMLIIQNYFGYVNYKNMQIFEFDKIDSSGLILDVNKLSKDIKNKLNKLKIPCKKMSFAIQNENIISRNIKILNTCVEKDIKGLIKYELSDYMPINMNEYILKYNILKKDEKYLHIQVIMMPKSIVNTYRKLAKVLKLKPTNLGVNFDILNKLIKNEKIKIGKEKNIILDMGMNSSNVNLVEDKIIKNSYTIENDYLIEFLSNELNENYKEIYYYGIKDKSFIEKLKIKFNIKELILNNKEFELNMFINNIGLN